VSERKPVGSTRTDKDTVVDLIGDDTSASPAQNGISHSGPFTQDLLADIFGSGDLESSASTSAPASHQSAASDIMNLFHTSSQSSSAAPASSNSLFDLVTPSASAPAPTPATAPAPQASKPQLQTYTAYDQNGLKITLTPKVSPSQPGTVQILARFTASVQADGVNFQVAVPKVRRIFLCAKICSLCCRRNNCKCKQCQIPT